MIKVYSNSIIILCILYQISPAISESDVYGTYDFVVTSYKLCAGPHPVNSSRVEIEPLPVNGSSVFAGKTFSNFTRAPIKGTVQFFKYGTNSYEYVTTFKIQNICDNAALKRKLFKKTYKLNTRCDILEGVQAFKNIKLLEVCHTFIGDKTFYGKYKFIAQFTSAKTNVVCFDMKVKLSKM